MRDAAAAYPIGSDSRLIATSDCEDFTVNRYLPVPSVVVRGENLIARGRNLVVTQSDPTAHAETVALRNAGAATGHADFLRVHALHDL